VKRLLILVAILAAATVLPAQMTGISGTVVDDSTGNPIPHATVRTMCGMAQTDSVGFYLIPNLRPGGYTVSAMARGYEPAVYPETVRVVQGQVTENINFRLTAMGGGGEPGGISGTVLDDATSEPVRGAWVYVHRMSVRTDSLGQYLLRLHPGRYIVGATAEGYEPEMYPDTVLVESGVVTPNIDFRLTPRGGGQNGGIAGIVTDAGNHMMIRGALVTATNGSVSREVTQGCRGYRFCDLPAGKYWVSATANGYDPGNYPDSVEVVAGRVTDHIDFALTRSGGGQNGGIAGMVTNAATNEPLFGAHVMARGRMMGRANTDSAGLYEIANLPAGHYVVVASARGFQPGAPETVAVVAGQITEDVDFALQPMPAPGTGAITGVVTDSATGLGIFGARLFAWGPSGQGFALTDSEGNYLVRHLRAGSYIVRACARGYRPGVWPESVAVAEGETTFDIDFVLVPAQRPMGGIAGFVYDGTEQLELAGVEVTAVGPSGTLQTRTDTRGEYRFDDIEPGDYRVQASANGFDPGPAVIVTAEPYAYTSFTTPVMYPLTGIEENRPTDPGPGASLLVVTNPVRGHGIINWQLSSPGMVSVRVVDNSGRVVRTIHQGTLSAGRHVATWDGTDDGGRRVASGIYFYHLAAPCGRSVQKVVLTTR